jgi:phosphate transport system protein
MTKPHTSRTFEIELEDVGARARAMAGRCGRSLELALEAFWAGSPALCDEMRGLERQIDDDERGIDALLVKILALRQSVAEDLRFLMATFKLTTDLERIGDEAKNIAEHASEAAGSAKELVRSDLEVAAQRARSMLEDAVRAFTSADAKLALDAIKLDEEIDSRYGRILTVMAEYMRSQPVDSTGAVRTIKVARYLERIGDHAKNVAEDAIFAFAASTSATWSEGCR